MGPGPRPSGTSCSARLACMSSWRISSYVSPRSSARIDARIVLIVHSSYVRDSNKEPWVQHDVEAYVKVDTKGWKTLARTVRPLIERILEEQVREAGYFISLMSRLVVTYPNWACQVVGSHPSIDAATKQRFNAARQSRRASQAHPRDGPWWRQTQSGATAGPAATLDRERRGCNQLAASRSVPSADSDLGILVRSTFSVGASGCIPCWIIAIRSLCLIDLLKTPSIVPHTIATIGIQANQGRALRIDTTLVIVSPFIRRRIRMSNQ